ncbi:hypothetical protein ACQ4LE_001476 [Meloidogyne hapla]|uniref:One cut domain family member n=1 Tax=Meloidogyne hapla TaxID=6305 RepID=A0A1I8BEP2_MELHA
MPPKVKRTICFLDSFETVFSESGSFISCNSDNEDDDPFLCSKEAEDLLDEIWVNSNKNLWYSKRRLLCTVSKIKKEKEENSLKSFEEDEMFYNMHLSSFDEHQQQKEFLNCSSSDQHFGLVSSNLTPLRYHQHNVYFNSDQFQSSVETTSCPSIGTSSGLPSPNDYFPVTQRQVILLDTSSANNYAAINYANNNSTTLNSLSESSNPTISSSCGCPVNTIKYEYDNSNIISSSINPTFHVVIPQQMPFQPNFLHSNNAPLAHYHTNRLFNERVKTEENSSTLNTPNNDFEVSDKNNDFFVNEQQQLFSHEGFPLEIKDNIVDNNFNEQAEEELNFQLSTSCQKSDLMDQIYDEHPMENSTPLLETDNGEIDTLRLAQHISQELKRYSIPQAIFAQRVLCRSQGTLSDLLRNPKPWSKLKSGRETFRRMAEWLQEPELQRMSALRLAACKRRIDEPLNGEPERMKAINDPEKTRIEENRTLSQRRGQKRQRLVFTEEQRKTLQAVFNEHKRPSRELQILVAQQLGLDLTTVANFFMNARRRGHANRSNNIVQVNSVGGESEDAATPPSWTDYCSSIFNGNSQEESPQTFMIGLEDVLITPKLNCF